MFGVDVTEVTGAQESTNASIDSRAGCPTKVDIEVTRNSAREDNLPGEYTDGA